MNLISPGQATVAQLRNMVNRLDVCMLITHGSDGKRNNRPIGAIKVDDNGYCWFFVSKRSGKLKDIAENNNIEIVFADPSYDAYVEIHGPADVCCDMEEIKNKWSPLVDQWFPQGINDPQVCLVSVRVNSVFYWDEMLNKIQRLVLRTNTAAEAPGLAA